jgi:transposase-like protein
MTENYYRYYYRHISAVHTEEVTEDTNMAESPSHKKQRRRYDNNLKAQLLEELSLQGTKLPAVAKKYGIPENTLRDWTKVSVVQSIEIARQKHGGTLKANIYDPLQRLTESLCVFFERNEQSPDHQKLPVTTKLVVSKGLEARNNLLELNEIQPFLESKEKRALESFTGSDSWAKKFAKRRDLKMTGARVKDLEDEDVTKFSAELRQMASRVKQAGPGYEEVASLLRQAGEKLVAARIVVARRGGRTQV